MFIAQLGKAVIGAYEEVVTADVVIVVIRRTMGWNETGVVVPLQLDTVGLMLPGKYCAVMDLSLVKLGWCAGKDGIDFALVEALAVAVKEGDVADAGPAVLDYGCGMEFGHSVYGVRVSTKIPN